MREKHSNQFVANLRLQHYMMLELTSLQLVHARKLHLRHIVPVHVHKDVLDHDDAELDLLPELIHALEYVFIGALLETLDHRLKELYRGLLDPLI